MKGKGQAKSIRDGFGKGLLEAGKKNKEIVVLTGNLGESTRVHWFAEEFPERFFDVGVAEQAMVTVAAGMALLGKIPFTTSYAVFSPGRTFEQLKITVCLNNLPVKIVGAHAGFGAGPYGATHQSFEDLALMRSLPGMVIVVPADFAEARKAVWAVAQNGRPTYLRLARQDSPVFTPDQDFEIGKAYALRSARNPEATIISCGPILAEALHAAEDLGKQGIEIDVLNCHTVKPLDVSAVIHAARVSGAIVTAEEHQIAGGLGEAVAQVLAQKELVPQEFVGLRDSFSESGTPAQLAAKFGLTAQNLVAAVKKVIARKSG